MNPALIRSFGMCLLALLLVLMAGIPPPGREEPPWPAPHESGSAAGPEDRGPDDMEQRRLGYVERLARKRQVVSELAAGHGTLLEAACRFRAIDRDTADRSWLLLCESYPEQFDDAAPQRQLLLHR